MSTLPVTRISLLTCFISTVPSFTPMLCIRCGVSCTGASGTSFSGAALTVKSVPVADGESILGVSASICIDGDAADEDLLVAEYRECHQNANSPAARSTFKLIATIIPRREFVVPWYPFIGNSPPSALLIGPGPIRDPPIPAGIQPGDSAHQEMTRATSR